MNQLHNDFISTWNTIESCKTTEQLLVAEEMAANFSIKYMNIDTPVYLSILESVLDDVCVKKFADLIFEENENG